MPLTERLRVTGVDRDEEVGHRRLDDPADVTRWSVTGDMNLEVFAAEPWSLLPRRLSKNKETSSIRLTMYVERSGNCTPLT